MTETRLADRHIVFKSAPLHHVQILSNKLYCTAAKGKQQHVFLISVAASPPRLPVLRVLCHPAVTRALLVCFESGSSCLKELGALVADFARPALSTLSLPVEYTSTSLSLLLCVLVIDSSKLRVPTAFLAQQRTSYNGCTRRRPLVHGQQAPGPGLQHNRKRLPRPASNCTLKPHTVLEVC